MQYTIIVPDWLYSDLRATLEKRCALLAPLRISDATKRIKPLVFDVDGDGLVSSDDLEVSLRLLVGGHLSSDEITTIVHKALAQADCPKGLDLADFQRVLSSSSLDIGVNIPLKY